MIKEPTSRLKATKSYKLLKNVARSFYLTIWWLPSNLREPVALAYLLARTSDTIADEGELLLEKRKKILVFLKLVAKGQAEILFLWEKSKEWTHFSQNKQTLIRQLPKILHLLQGKKYSTFEAEWIKKIWQIILEGQLMDLRYQDDQKKFSSSELEEYLYLVAGAVGKFLTQLASKTFPTFATASLDTMNAWAINYGKGLQLINILRDFSEDQQQGKFYFSKEERDHYHDQACTYLKQGEAYVAALRPGRFKVACALPFLLGQQTLRLIKKYPDVKKLKIRRWRVYVTLLRALRFLV